MHLITASEFGPQIPCVKGVHFAGSNAGNKIGDIKLPVISSLWHLTIKNKLALHGRFRTAVGGQTPGEQPGNNNAKKKQLDAKEPTFWHARDPKLLAEIVHRYKFKAVLDMGPADGTFAHLCATSKPPIPYFGFTLTETHTTLLKNHLVQKIMTTMATEGTKIYDPEFAKLFSPEMTPEPKKKPKTARETDDGTSEAPESSSELLDSFKKKIEKIKKKRSADVLDDQDQAEPADSQE